MHWNTFLTEAISIQFSAAEAAAAAALINISLIQENQQQQQQKHLDAGGRQSRIVQTLSAQS
jgi:hypothetical protein